MLQNAKTQRRKNHGENPPQDLETQDPSAQEPLTAPSPSLAPKVRVCGNKVVLSPLSPSSPRHILSPHTPDSNIPLMSQKVSRDAELRACQLRRPLTHTSHSTVSAVCSDFCSLHSGYSFSQFFNLIQSCQLMLVKNKRPSTGLQSLKISYLPRTAMPISSDTENNCRLHMSPDTV